MGVNYTWTLSRKEPIPKKWVVFIFWSSWQNLEENIPAIASLEDLKSAQKDLLEAKDLDELKAIFKKWRRIGWKNVCKLWLQERTPEQLKGEGDWNTNSNFKAWYLWASLVLRFWYSEVNFRGWLKQT